MSAINTLCDRVHRGRQETYKLTGLDPSYSGVEVVISVDLHMRVMAELAERSCKQALATDAVFADPSAPSHLRVFGLPVRRDLTFADDEIRFRREVVI